MRVSITVGSINQCLELWYIFWMSKVNNIDGYIVFLQSYTQLLEFILSLPVLKWMSNKDYDSLSL